MNSEASDSPHLPLSPDAEQGESALLLRPLFGVQIHAVTMDCAVRVIDDWMRGDASRCKYVVTPNVQHIVKLQSDHGLHDAYRHASLVIADGWPLVMASRWVNRPLPERVAGSDLVPALFTLGKASQPLSVFLLGAASGVGAEAQRRIEERWPHVKVRGVLSPPLGFEHDAAACQAIVDAVNACRPQLLVVGLGAPKQEMWLRRYASQLDAKVAIAAGATIDFLAGRQRRAPRWIQRLHLEWLYRALSDPRRLAGRYMRDALAFPPLVWREWRTRHVPQRPPGPPGGGP